jgi:hypothetical protein
MQEKPTLRVLAVQRRPELSSEASVLRTLLSAASATSAADSLNVLLIQGVDQRRPLGRQAVGTLRALEWVSLHRLDVGSLGRQGLTKWQWAL